MSCADIQEDPTEKSTYFPSLSLANNNKRGGIGCYLRKLMGAKMGIAFKYIYYLSPSLSPFQALRVFIGTN